jgi:hypothetical protein
MPIELSHEQRAALEQTRRADTPAEFQALMSAARPEMSRVVREVMEPNQSIQLTVTELRDLYLTVTSYEPKLTASGYGPARRTLLRDAVRLLETAHVWFGEGQRTGVYKVRTIEELVAASRPWRERLAAYGGHAFWADPEVADQLGDVNASGTLEEEQQNLERLLLLIEQHRAALEAVGLSDAFALEGKQLLEEASGRDLLGVLGIRNRDEGKLLRNRIATYATMLGREARAAGINACFDDPVARGRFEAASFRDAVRRMRPKRRAGEARRDDDAPEEPAAPNGAAGGEPPATPS